MIVMGLGNGVLLSVTQAEADILQPLLAEIETWTGRPFAKEPRPHEQQPPEWVLTPNRLRERVRTRLAPLARRDELLERILDAMTIGGRPIREVAGAAWQTR